MHLLDFIMTLTVVNLDEIVISNYINLGKKQDLEMVYGRLLQSYHNKLNLREFSMLAKTVVNNEQELNDFLKNKVVYLNQRLRNKNEGLALQRLYFTPLLAEHPHFQNVPLINNVQYVSNSIFQQANIFDQKIIELIINHLNAFLGLELEVYAETIGIAIKLLVKIQLIHHSDSIIGTFN